MLTARLPPEYRFLSSPVHDTCLSLNQPRSSSVYEVKGEPSIMGVELHGIWVKMKYLYRGRGLEPRIWKISRGFSFSYCMDLFLVRKLQKSMVHSEFSTQFCIRIVCSLWMTMLICVWSEQVRRHNLARPTFAVVAHFWYFLPLSKFDH